MPGIDVSLELSSVCVVDGRGKIVKEAKVASEPPSPDAWGRLTSEPRFIIYRETATFTPCSERGPLRHLVKDADATRG